MTKKGKACFAVVLALVAGLGVGSFALAAEHDTDKIDVCRYGAESLDELRELIEAAAVGKSLTHVAEVLGYEQPDELTPGWTDTGTSWWSTGKVDMEYQYKIGVPQGRLSRFIKECPQDFGNMDRWVIYVLFEDDGTKPFNPGATVLMVDTFLFYEDPTNFAQRNEPITARRYEMNNDYIVINRDESFNSLVEAVRSLGQSRPYTREEARREMIAGGFWFMQSCEDRWTVTDNYDVPPFPPDGLFGSFNFFNYYWQAPSVAITFAKSSGEFVDATEFYEGDPDHCQAAKTYKERSRELFLSEYPDSWGSRYFRGEVEW